MTYDPRRLANRTEYEAVVGRLVGRQIEKATYYGLHDYNEHIEDWDYGDWHHPVMGVELTMMDAGVYSAVWGSSFTHYGLEIFPSQMSVHLAHVGEPDGPPRWDVTTHPRWVNLVGQPIAGAQILWDEAVGDLGPVQCPTAVRLDFSTGSAWLIAAAPRWTSPQSFWVGTDEVVVGFSEDFARSLGLASGSR
ncbi:hypothetical protein AB0J63_37670 [Streptosporangium canum]|uniref:hypothetical protein n=1 Tax=Streptosporangium canum TaxID=324952 RepID=UPI003438FFF7